MKLTIALLAIGIALSGAACNQSGSTKAENVKAEPAKPESTKPAVNRTSEEADLKATDIAWSAAAGKKDVDAVAGFMTADGATLPPNEPIAKGMDAVKKGWAAILSLKDVQISWQPTSVQVADSGEIGYTSGTYSLSFTDPKGAKVNDTGKYLEVWKKVDGKWKCHLDMYNSDIPLK
jgi:ketosteroid isomerase-like protein